MEDRQIHKIELDKDRDGAADILNASANVCCCKTQLVKSRVATGFEQKGMSYDTRFINAPVWTVPRPYRGYQPKPRKQTYASVKIKVFHGKAVTEDSVFLKSMPRGQCQGADPQGGVLSMSLG